MLVLLCLEVPYTFSPDNLPLSLPYLPYPIDSVVKCPIINSVTHWTATCQRDSLLPKDPIMSIIPSLRKLHNEHARLLRLLAQRLMSASGHHSPMYKDGTPYTPFTTANVVIVAVCTISRRISPTIKFAPQLTKNSCCCPFCSAHHDSMDM